MKYLDLTGLQKLWTKIKNLVESHKHTIDNVEGLQDALDDKQESGSYVTTDGTGVQSIAGGLVVGGKSATATGKGRIMVTGNTNPLIGLQAIDSSGKQLTPYYFQVSNNKMYLGPTSAKALAFDSNGNTTIPANLTVTGDITEGGTALSSKYAAKSNATQSAAGLMSADDKKKLDGNPNSLSFHIENTETTPISLITDAMISAGYLDKGTSTLVQLYGGYNALYLCGVYTSNTDGQYIFNAVDLETSILFSVDTDPTEMTLFEFTDYSIREYASSNWVASIRDSLNTRIDNLIIDLGEQSDHREAQASIVNHIISTNAEEGSYLFRYWVECSGSACLAVVYFRPNEFIYGSVYDSMIRYRAFEYRFSSNEFTYDGCWLSIASFAEEFDWLTTENKTVLEAINELNAKIGSSSGGGIIDLGYCRDDTIVQTILDKLEEMYGNEPITDTEIFKYYDDDYCRACLVIVNVEKGEDIVNATGIIYDNEGRRKMFYGNSVTGESPTSQEQEWEDLSSGGGATLSMPRIRFANYRYDEPVYMYDESWEFTGKITFSVHIQDGTVREGDQIQLCKMAKTYGKNKLRAILSRTITAEDIENLAKQPYLQITTDDCAGNAIGGDTDKVLDRLSRTDTNNLWYRKPKYIRIRRPVYKDGMVVNAFFSNVEPVDMRLKYEFIYGE